jgi:hypothetical protein
LPHRIDYITALLFEINKIMAADDLASFKEERCLSELLELLCDIRPEVNTAFSLTGTCERAGVTGLNLGKRKFGCVPGIPFLPLF